MKDVKTSTNRGSILILQRRRYHLLFIYKQRRLSLGSQLILTEIYSWGKHTVNDVGLDFMLNCMYNILN